MAGLIGGGSGFAMPGEISRANLGVSTAPLSGAPEGEVACGGVMFYIVGEMAAQGAEWREVEQAAAELGLTVTTLRRWCRTPDGPVFARHRGRSWEVNMTQLREYLQVRRRAGASRIRFEGFNYLGLEPNPRLKDATGWRFALGRKDGEEPLYFRIWVGSELIQRLKVDGVDVFDALLRAGERLVEDKELRPDRLWLEERTIELAIEDRVRLLTAAGRAPDFLLPGEADPEEGVPVLYEMTARDSGSVGEYMQVQKHPAFADLIVDWSAQAGRRLLSTIRLRLPIAGMSAEAVRRGLTAYKDRCRRLGQVPGVWLRDVEDRLA
jgi:hypothetical protein